MTPPSSSTAVHGRRRGSPRDEETERLLARDRPAADRAEPSHRAAVDAQADETDGARERAGEQERSRPAPARPAFRTELHGLRGLAVLLVAVYHVWFGRVSGGVDVFLFLSAFFLTGTFTRRAETGQPLAIPRYWLRTFKRLMPPAAIVIVATLAMSLAVLPASSWTLLSRHALASALYVQNIVLAAEATDYYAHDASAASPFQHFWSLSVQGQVFLLWPLLFALAGLLATGGRRRPPVRTVLMILFAVVLLASLTWSIIDTERAQSSAYFSTVARLWEFAAGSLMALLLPWWDRRTGSRRPEDGTAPLHPTGRALLGWLGVAGLLSCGAVLQVSTAFPGWIALWPLVSAALVMAAGFSSRRWGADAVLSRRPARFLGDISYSLYLVHWPLLVGWLAVRGGDRAGPLDGVVVLAASIVLAWLLTRLVDTPIRRSPALERRWWRAGAVVAASLALVLASSLVAFPAARHVIEGGSSEGGAPTASTHPGARWTTDPLADLSASPAPLPDALSIPQDLLPDSCTGRFGSADAVYCRYQPASGTPAATILLAGDSHAAQYASALMEEASSHHWAVYYVGKMGCSFSTASGNPGCATIDAAWPTVLDSIKPDVVITIGSRTTASGPAETARPDLGGALELVRERHIASVVLRDNPRWSTSPSPYDCAFDVIRDGGTPASADADCGADLSAKAGAQDPIASLADDDPSAPVLVADPTTDQLCPRDRCSPIVGNVFVYRDDNHLTTEFSRSMGPWFGAEVQSALAARDRAHAAPAASDG